MRARESVRAALTLVFCACADAPASVPETTPGEDRAWPVEWSVEPSLSPRFERVILVTIDTLRPDHLGCYGYARETSPFLDRLASAGVRFTNVLSSISHTAPAHATIFTGLPPASHGLVKNGMVLDERATGMAELFSAAGYETAAFYNTRFLGGTSAGFDVRRAAPNEGYRVLAAASKWIQEERTSDRFFLWMHLFDPHHWNQDHLAPVAEIEEVRSKLAWSDEELYAYVAELHGIMDADPESMDQYIGWFDSYDGHILRADRLLERFEEVLVEEGLDADTLWVITSDHGEGLGAHGYAGHTARIYNEQLRVPLIVYASDGSFGSCVIDALAQHVDLLPTFADLLGAELRGLDPHIDGRSLLPLLEGDVEWPSRIAFAERSRLDDEPSLTGLQTTEFKLLVHGDGREEFFDLSVDPREQEDLGQTPERTRLRALLDQRLTFFGARAPSPAEGAGETQSVSEDWHEELKALGYIE